MKNCKIVAKRLTAIAMCAIMFLVCITPFAVMADDSVDAMWAELFAKAEAAVTEEQIAEIEEWKAAEEAFFANLSPESLWDAFVDANPDVYELSEGEIRYARHRMDELYTFLREDILNQSNATPNSTFVGNAGVYARRFSTHDGLHFTTQHTIEAIGFAATAEARIRFTGMQEDAFRHYYWNFRSVTSITVGTTQNGRLNSTRIHTTNRELATNILRRNPSLNVPQPTVQQVAACASLKCIAIQIPIPRSGILWSVKLS